MSGPGAGRDPRVGDAPWRVQGRCHSCLSGRNQENRGREKGGRRKEKGERREETEIRQERKKMKEGVGKELKLLENQNRQEVGNLNDCTQLKMLTVLIQTKFQK